MGTVHKCAPNVFCRLFGSEPFQKEGHLRVFCDVSNVCCTSNRFLWESGQSFSRLFLCMCFVTFWCKTIPGRKHVRVFCDVSRLLRNQHISVEIKSIIFSNNFVNVRGFVAMHGVGKLVLCMWFQTWTGRQNLCYRSLNQNKAFRVLIVCPTNMETASQTSGTSQKTPTRRSLWDGFTNKTAKTCTTRPEK